MENTAQKIRTDIVAPLRLGDNISAQPVSGKSEVSSKAVHSIGRGGYEHAEEMPSTAKQ